MCGFCKDERALSPGVWNDGLYLSCGCHPARVYPEHTDKDETLLEAKIGNAEGEKRTDLPGVQLLPRLC